MTIKEYFLLHKAKKRPYKFEHPYPEDDEHNRDYRILQKHGYISLEVNVKNNELVYSNYELTDDGLDAMHKAVNGSIKATFAYIAGVFTPVITYMLLNLMHIVNISLH